MTQQEITVPCCDGSVTLSTRLSQIIKYDVLYSLLWTPQSSTIKIEKCTQYTLISVNKPAVRCQS